MKKKIDDPVSFFRDLGALHDARIQEIAWHPEAGRIALLIDDLQSNFLGLEGYTGPQAAEITCSGVRTTRFSGEFRDPTLNVYGLEARCDESDTISVSVTFWPEGRLDIVCAAVEWSLQD